MRSAAIFLVVALALLAGSSNAQSEVTASRCGTQKVNGTCEGGRLEYGGVCLCPSGTEWRPEQCQCVPCLENEYSDMPCGECRPCAPDFVPEGLRPYISDAGARRCGCQPGWEPADRSNLTQHLCSKCPPGLYKPDISEVACCPCPEGTHPNADQSGCDSEEEIPDEQCAADPVNGQCTGGRQNYGGLCLCPPGTEYNEADHRCDACDEGEYNDIPCGECLPCAPSEVPPGHVPQVPTEDQRECGCPAGYEPRNRTNLDEHICRPCPPGSYRSDISEVECCSCPEGFHPSEDQTHCVPDEEEIPEIPCPCSELPDGITVTSDTRFVELVFGQDRDVPCNL